MAPWISSSEPVRQDCGIPAIKMQNVTYAYESGARPIIDGVSLTVNAGEWVTVTGPSGCGKSTLSGLLSGYLPRAGGGIRTGGLKVSGLDPATAEIADMAGLIGIVFQDPDAQLVQGRVEDEVAFGPENLCYPPEIIEGRVTAALRDVDLQGRRRDSVNQLSGGGRQRTAIASVLALEPPILVLDEAAASLDAAARRRLLALLRQLHQHGRTLVTVTGRLDELALAAQRMVVLNAGRVAADGPAAQLLREHRPLLGRLGLLPPGAPATGEASLGAAAPEIQPGGSDAVSGAADSIAGPNPGPHRSGGSPLLEIAGLSFAYGSKTRRQRRTSVQAMEPAAVLQDIHMSIREGEWHILRGENGSGKTTLSRLMLGLLQAPPECIYWRGRDVSRLSLYELAADIGYVFQHPERQFVSSTVLDELLYGPRSTLRLRPKENAPGPVLRQARDMLRLVGLEGREQTSPYLLSGGEKRLLSVAACFMLGKKLILLDEPTVGTDYAGARLLSELCRKTVAQGAALLMITHEPEFFAGENTRIWTLENGRLREE
ncbi:energy-coupling factor transport system ATP-binding protein [Fontibacillus phaseoli]|uniref:Energy-coupling factor transport system ATP-binding protein n=1 Tax=Fontibacillus phaseoli TaxID=1416533 RepID=A0A369B6M2_9BACL|nr:ABC transporter ATP-binding protein [Fontibacillus phaseoli]RCX16186.1 energy-coupling factor transport system ATP-binding protein [Fontibacillus phaseoli]